MTNLEDMLKLLAPITASIVAVAVLLEAILRLIKAGGKLWNELRPSIKYLILIVTQIAPTGMVIWYFMYWAAENSIRLTEPVVFLLLIAESTMLVSLYALFWWTWFYPKLKSLFVGQKPTVRRPQGNPPRTKSNTESPSDEEYQ